MADLFFKLQVLPEKRQELMQTLEAIRERTLDMKDCLGFHLHQDPENLNSITLMMEWRSLEALRHYQQESEHFGVLLGAFNLLCESQKGWLDTKEELGQLA